LNLQNAAVTGRGWNWAIQLLPAAGTHPALGALQMKIFSQCCERRMDVILALFLEVKN
jgi:hypothetical protein